jgi:hypothetical protein
MQLFRALALLPFKPLVSNTILLTLDQEMLPRRQKIKSALTPPQTVLGPSRRSSPYNPDYNGGAFRAPDPGFRSSIQWDSWN